MSTTVAGVNAVFTGDASGVVAASAQAAEALKKVARTSETVKADLDRAVSGDLGAATIQRLEVELQKTIALEKQLAAATAANNDATKLSVKSFQDAAKNVNQYGGKIAGAIGQVAGAAGAASPALGKATQAFAGMAGAFAVGGPILAGAAAIGAIVSLAMESIADASEKAKAQSAAAADQMQKLVDRGKELIRIYRELQGGPSVEVQTAKAEQGAAAKARAQAQVNLDTVREENQPGADPYGIGKKRIAEAEEVYRKAIEAETKARENVAQVILNEAAKKSKDEKEAKAKEDDAEAKRLQAEEDAADDKARSRLTDKLFADLKLEADAAGASAAAGALLADLAEKRKKDTEEMNARTAAADKILEESKKREATAAAIQAKTEEAKANLAAAGELASVGADNALQSALGGNNPVDFASIGAIIGTAMGGPAGAAAGSMIGEAIVSGMKAIVGPLGDLFGGSEVAQKTGEGALMGGAAAAVLSAPLGGILAPLGALAGGMMQASTTTKNFAEMQEVVNKAFEHLAEPLNIIWTYMQPVAGAFFQLAEALNPLLSMFLVLVPMEPILDVLMWTLIAFGNTVAWVTGAIATVVKLIAQFAQTLTGGLVGGKEERAANKMLKRSEEALDAISKISEQSGQKRYNELTKPEEEKKPGEGSETEKKTLDQGFDASNVPTGYKGLAGAIYKSANATGPDRIDDDGVEYNLDLVIQLIQGKDGKYTTVVDDSRRNVQAAYDGVSIPYSGRQRGRNSNRKN